MPFFNITVFLYKLLNNPFHNTHQDASKHIVVIQPGQPDIAFYLVQEKFTNRRCREQCNKQCCNPDEKDPFRTPQHGTCQTVQSRYDRQPGDHIERYGQNTQSAEHGCKQQKKTYNIDQAVCQITADVVGKAAYTQRFVNFAVIILQKRIL